MNTKIERFIFYGLNDLLCTKSPSCIIKLYFYLQEGPMVEGISPVEANDRLQIFQVVFYKIRVKSGKFGN